MRYALILALFCTAAHADDVTLTIPEERVQECNAAGGCALLSKAEVAALMQRAYVLGAQAAAEALAENLDTNGCRRDKT